MSEEKKYPIFISRKPVGEDQFEGKSQKKIADSIIDQIEHPDQSIKMIGLEGDWGTGKSNVIEIVRNHFKSSSTVFFIYDVWGHQEDLQRKSILTELINYLSKDLAIVKAPWIEKVKKLTGTIVEHKTTSTPRISLGMVLSFLILILTPLCGVIADSKDDTDLKGKIFWFLVPCFALIGLYLFYIIIALFKIKSKGNREWYKYLFYDTIVQFFSVYKDKEIETFSTEYTNESNPSVLDFNQFMKDLSFTLEDNHKALVIVFDNMDRLPVEKVKDLWSSIHTFFSEQNYPSITTIVTFDRNHINQAFGDEKNPTIGNDYINKTFDVVYRVSLPILSDWKHFFKNEWKYAFGKAYPDSELENIILIFENLSLNFTPRSIISFINDCVSIRKICSEKVADRYVALFILSKNDLFKKDAESKDNDEKTQTLDQKLIEKTYLGSLEYLYADDEELEKNMAALVYQIEPENALSAVYTKKLQDAINKNLPIPLGIIQKSSVFIDIIDSAINNLTDIQKSIISLNSFSDDVLGNRKQAIWDIFYAKAKKMNLEKLTDTNQVSELQNILIKNITRKEEYIKNYVLIENKDLGKFSPADYWSKLQSLKKCCEENHLDFNLLLPELKLKPEQYLSFLKVINDTASKYKVTVNLDELDNFLSQKKVEDLQALLPIKYYEEKTQMNKFRDSLKEILKTKANTKDLLVNTVALLNELNEEDEHTDLSLIPQNLICTIGGTLNPDSAYLADFCAIRFAFNNPQIQYGQIPIDQQILQKSNPELTKSIAKILPNYLDFSDIFLDLEAYINLPVYKDVCIFIINNENEGGDVADINALVNKFNYICAHLSVDHKVLLKRFNPWSKYYDEKGVDVSKLIDSNFIIACNEVNNDLAKKCIASINSYFSKYNLSQWTAAFSNFGQIGVKQALLSNYNWSNDAYNAASTILKQQLNPNITSIDITKWNEIISSMNRQDKSFVPVFKDIRDEFTTGRQKMTVPLFNLWGPWLFEYSDLESDPNSCRTLLIPAILSDSKAKEILVNNIKKLPKIVAKAGKDSSEFTNKLKDLNKTSDPSISKICSELGFEPESKK